MLEEECHRNHAFTLFHAGEMPELAFGRVEAERAGTGGDLWAISVEVENERLIPTRTRRARDKKIGRNDLLTCEPSRGQVVLSGSLGRWWDTAITRSATSRVGCSCRAACRVTGG